MFIIPALGRKSRRIQSLVLASCKLSAHVTRTGEQGLERLLSIKHLLHKSEDLNSDPEQPRQKYQCVTVISVPGEQRQENLWRSLASYPCQSVSSRFSDWLCLKKLSISRCRKTPTIVLWPPHLCAQLYMQTFTWTSTHIHTQVHVHTGNCVHLGMPWQVHISILMALSHSDCILPFWYFDTHYFKYFGMETGVLRSC